MYKISLLVCLAVMGSYGNVLKRQGKYHKILSITNYSNHSSIPIITLENEITEIHRKNTERVFLVLGLKADPVIQAVGKP